MTRFLRFAFVNLHCIDSTSILPATCADEDMLDIAPEMAPDGSLWCNYCSSLVFGCLLHPQRCITATTVLKIRVSFLIA